MSAIRAKSALRTIQFTSLATVIALMSACGGGGGSTDDVLGNDGPSRESNQNPTDPPTTDTPTLQLSLGAGEGGSFQQGQLITALGNDDLAHGGELEVSVNIVDSSDNSLYTASNVAVYFGSNCAENGKATIDSPIITDNGVASTIYRATTCEGNETVWATINGSRAETSFDVASIETGSLEFVSVESGTIAIKGTGSIAIPETTKISFIVKDKEGNPIPGETLTYSLSTTVGGISLSRQSSVTNADGIASVFLNAGTVQTTVSVIATMEASYGGQLSISSPAISIVGAIPDQDSFSIGATVLNPRGWNANGVTSTIIVRAADRNNNPAPDSTQINFVTDGGAIVGSCALTDGDCSVIWSSQAPRPADGLVNILARSTGEESFTDTNGNGRYDIGETFTDTNEDGIYNEGEQFIDANNNGIYDPAETITTPMGEAYLDENNNGRYDLGEFFSDFDGNGVYTPRPADSDPDTDEDNEYYQGASCSADALAAGHCASLVEVRDSITLCMSTDEVLISDNQGGSFDADFEDTVRITLTDAKGLTPAHGTEIDIDAHDLVIVAGDKVSVPNACSTNGFSFDVVVKEDDEAGSGTLVITVTQANGAQKIHTITVRD